MREFGTIRAEALDTWKRGRLDDDNVEWECRWQVASTPLPHDCATPGCQTHVNLYCSYIDLAEQVVDLLEDERLDPILVGFDEGDVFPWPDSNNLDAAALYRFYVRVLWAAGVMLDDLEHLLKMADIDGNHRALLTAGTPLGAQELMCFINRVCKHGTTPGSGVHCWNHHAAIYFEDSRLDESTFAGMTVFDARHTVSKTAKYDTLRMPGLLAIVETLIGALRNADSHLNAEEVLQLLAREHGTCLYSQDLGSLTT